MAIRVKKLIKKIKEKAAYYNFLVIFWITALIILLFGSYNILFFGRIYQGVHVGSINVSRLTKNEARQKMDLLVPKQVIVISENPKFEFTLNLSISYNINQTLKNAYDFGREGNIIYNLKNQVSASLKGTNLPLVYTLNQDKLEKEIDNIVNQIRVPAIESNAAKAENSSIVINPGQDGIEADKQKLKEKILETIAYARFDPIPVPITITKSQLEDNQTQILKRRAEKLINKNLTLQFEDQKFLYKDSDIISFLTPTGIKKNSLNQLANGIADHIDRSAQNARFVFADNRVKEFTPALTGIQTKKTELEEEIRQAVENLIQTNIENTKITIPVIKTDPEISTGQVNNLGIKELIGKGTSQFHHSIASRVHNIALAASRLNGLLIKPDEIFSFDQALGDISVYTGYQQAYIIQNGQTILGDGGGVCQVSTTFFRAALAAGLPIAERHAHAYRVGYYEQDSKPGFDATIYSPTVDLKIKNDTGNYILIQSKVDIKNMTLEFDFYGTKDGRVVSASTPRLWDPTPAPPPAYQDDPTLPVGSIKQIDFAAGGLKASFNYKVTKGNEILQNRTFYSNYQPWQAKYLRGTKLD